MWLKSNARYHPFIKYFTLTCLHYVSLIHHRNLHKSDKNRIIPDDYQMDRLRDNGNGKITSLNDDQKSWFTTDLELQKDYVKVRMTFFDHVSLHKLTMKLTIL